MVLEKYKQKRKFEITGEPKGVPKEKGEFKFVVQEHQATHLHYDFRLSLPENPPQKETDTSGGRGFWVLKSWAIPKKPPFKSGIKRLAVEVEDHPLEYISFEGEIPKGEYGAGKVKIWDKGDFELKRRTENEIEVELFGKKLKGLYFLIRTKMGGQKKNWLLFKK